jgi:hypothetical protein
VRFEAIDEYNMKIKDEIFIVDRFEREKLKVKRSKLSTNCGIVV